MRALLVLFIVIPILEMWLLIEVGGMIGALATIFLVFLTAVVGLALLRQQGLQTLFRVNQRMQQGQLPATEILEGVALAVGGALLLTPGFITDGVGFMCLLPITRRLMVVAVIKRGMVSSVAGSKHQHHSATFYKQHSSSENNSGDGPVTIDGEYKRDD